ncbi:class I SAM-dependent methyltransferase [Oceanospirillum linum]|uniref:Protein methyltransferase n=1 Tax=Oceanospirillum linum TaxID=966 RepID=A0A1T1HDV8_OCELI|nr:50S ribosomal protein L11 methyltransferase [Oceanospirillum linum]OOV87910.1 hypothetical protein BTA35_0207945 [Oceanospirillum linum]SEG50935.1 Predicted nicotinamide N-methyase [Oleiphilus messinensis]SMP35296.1 Predicted nicotinamide N-methyase [Oceanospirillum linum]
MSLLLNRALSQMLPSARVKEVTLPGVDKIRLWLVDPEPVDRAFSSDEMIAILEHAPYWGFCWGSGLALARFILENPAEVVGKRVIDFGAGSGVVAVAAAMAGAEVIACDIDPVSQLACKENARLNKVSFQVAADLLALPEMGADLLIAADVLYDRDNLPWLDTFFRFAPEVWVADSRVRNFSHSSYQLVDTFNANTVPEMGEPYEFSSIRFYRSV